MCFHRNWGHMTLNLGAYKLQIEDKRPSGPQKFRIVCITNVYALNRNLVIRHLVRRHLGRFVLFYIYMSVQSIVKCVMTTLLRQRESEERGMMGRGEVGRRMNTISPIQVAWKISKLKQTNKQTNGYNQPVAWIT